MSKIALYIRLSVEDQVKVDESESIISQRMYLNDYLDKNAELKHLERVEYVDDGYSGTNEKRPSYQRLLEDVKSGQVKNILVKDMSRFLRDYIALGDYLENIFPFLGIRFIAINDGYDSNDEVGNGTDLDVQFKTLMYDFYSKDASVKTKTVKDTLNRQGKVQAWSPAYGYMKDPNDKHKIIIDEKVAWVVRKIFDFALDGLSTRKIAEYLNAEAIDVPSKRKLELTEMDYASRFEETDSSTWTNGAVIDILNNENYTGTYVFNMYERSIFIGRKSKARPKDEWERVYNNHEAIISIEEFEKAKALRENNSFLKGKKNTDFPWRQHSPLQGFARCPICNHILGCQKTVRKQKIKDKVFRYFRCRICKLNGISRDGSNADYVEPIVLEAIKNRYDVKVVEEAKPTDIDVAKELQDLELSKQLSYEKYKLGKITRLDFIDIKKKIDVKIQELEELNSVENESVDVPVEELTRELMDQYIESVLLEGNEVLEIKWK
ncbi:recombinase family protein [Helcococcus ovis]|uniref:recombinase family protein n=1 Tax=Helcococcus ovis TaxID=72026 RepID=UPI0038B7DB31